MDSLQLFLTTLDQRTAGELRTDTYNRTLYSTDASIYQVMPHGVLLPESTGDVQAAVELADNHDVPILPRTGGSSLAGQAVNEALVIDMSRHLDSILEVNPEEEWVRVQPGVVLDELNLYLEPLGLQFGPDPASSNRAAMGGIVSNNSTGSHSILYGMTADHVREMTVILNDGSRAQFGPVEDGELADRRTAAGRAGQIYDRIAALTRDERNREIIRSGTPRHWRRCGGYNLDRFVGRGASFRYPRDERFNLAKLVCGAEGTLAVIEDVTLNLVPRPKKTALAVVQFDRLYDALAAVPVILQTDPSAIELLDNLGLTLCREVPQYARLLETFIEGQPDCVLITEFYGKSERTLEGKIRHLKEHLRSENTRASTVVSVLDQERQDKVWTVRKVGLGLLMSIKGDYKPIPFIEDAAVPPGHLAEYVTKIERFCKNLRTDVAYYAHASAGCVHIRPLINTKKAEEVAKLPKIVSFSIDLLKGYGGSLSSEHGDGRARSPFNEQFYGPKLYGLYEAVKRTFDPKNLLNPGNIVDAPAMTENLRYGEDYETIPLDTHLDFSEDQGFDGAVEMCNGAGICRKKTTGTMCPSFMATREEEDSTRGRANALRAAISGRIDPDELTSERMYEVMDLCIGCKACKAECPSSVDMAKIKFEFLAQYREAHGTPTRARLFGDIHRVSRLSSGPLAPVVNRMMQSRPMRRVMEQVAGISREPTLPAFAREPFTEWFANHSSPAPTAGKVVLFNDTFNTYNHPRPARAATELLEAAGYEVILSEHGCCGRPMISKGLVEKARAAARSTVDRLAPYAADGIPIVGLEPSCLLSLRDEYAYLLPDDDRVEILADRAYMLEEFIARQADDEALDLTFTDEPREILLHGHCHQKSLVGTVPTREMLRLPPNYSVTEVDSGCCGMAGSFGYEKEHYEVSMTMAERRLLPAVRSAGENTLIAAAGTSCRHQIADGTDRQALHPVEILWEAVEAD
jgi:FAD/FMN-containing dehydrogenase/Fe-S oxidoreductase